jgi:hypothetical protein
MTTHKHIWKRSERQHKRPGRIFVECECGITRQASIVTGSLVVFDTGRDQGGKTVEVAFRLDKSRHKKLRTLKVNVRKVIEEYLDKL